MQTVLVTGASGFTGRYMVDALLDRGLNVVGVGTHPTLKYQCIACDLTDQQAVIDLVNKVRPDWIVHLAALSFVGHTDHLAFYNVNVFGTLNLLNAVKKLDYLPKKILIASSANIYGTPNLLQIGEDTVPSPVNHYACSKLSMEHMVSNGYSDLPVIITRPFNYTGPGQDNRFLIPKIVEHFARGDRIIELGNIDVSRDFSDVRDLVCAYMLLLESDTSGEIVNVCSGKDTSLRSVIEQMNLIAGYEIDVRVNPAFVRSNEIPRLCGSYDLLKGLVGWMPSIELTQTLSDMYLYNKDVVNEN